MAAKKINLNKTDRDELFSYLKQIYFIQDGKPGYPEIYAHLEDRYTKNPGFSWGETKTPNCFFYFKRLYLDGPLDVFWIGDEGDYIITLEELADKIWNHVEKVYSA